MGNTAVVTVVVVVVVEIRVEIDGGDIFTGGDVNY